MLGAELRCEGRGAGTGNPVEKGNSVWSHAGVPAHMSRCLGTKSVGACLDVLPAPAPAHGAGAFWGGALARTLAETGRARGGDMDISDTDPTVTRALALALMRQAKDYLRATGDLDAAQHVEHAIDTLLKPRAAAAT